MSSHHEGTSVSPDVSSSKGKIIISPEPISSSDLVKVPPPSPLTSKCPAQLACFISSCPSVFGGEAAHLDLREHLKSEHGRLFAALGFYPLSQPQLGVTQANHVYTINLVGDDKEDGEGGSQAAELELNSQSMGTIGVPVSHMVAILEGMRAAEGKGDDVRVSIIFIIILFIS